jgi:bacillithiol biosynthesis deacetylase BshB1
MKINIVAFGAHPDDVELSASGTLMKHKLLGHKIGIVDLTRGELGSRGTIETRAEESKLSSSILDLDIRINLGFEDGFFINDKAHQLKVIQAIRTYQPDIALINAPTDRHPDHGKGATVLIDSCFLAGLVKIETTDEQGNIQKPWRPKRVFHYIQDKFLEPDFIIDISEVFEKKLDSIRAFGTQFFSTGESQPPTYIASSGYIESVERRAAQLGKRIGVKYGEGFLQSGTSLGFNDMSSILLPELV